MLKVYFKKPWFSPEAKRYRKSVSRKPWGWQDVPDALEDQLPSDCVIMERVPDDPDYEAGEGGEGDKASETLADHDHSRAGDDHMRRQVEEADQAVEDAQERRAQAAHDKEEEERKARNAARPRKRRTKAKAKAAGK